MAIWALLTLALVELVVPFKDLVLAFEELAVAFEELVVAFEELAIVFEKLVSGRIEGGCTLLNTPSAERNTDGSEQSLPHKVSKSEDLS